MSDQTNSVKLIPFCQMNLWRVRENFPSPNKLREWRDDDYIDNDDAIDNDCCDDVVSSVLSIATEHLLFIYFHFFFAFALYCACLLVVWLLLRYIASMARLPLHHFVVVLLCSNYCLLQFVAVAVFFACDSMFCFSVCTLRMLNSLSRHRT